MSLLLGRPWLRQPQGFVPPARTGPGTDSLSFLWNALSPTIDLASGARYTAQGSTFLQTTRPGYGGLLGLAGDGTGISYLDFPSGGVRRSSLSYTVFAYISDTTGTGAIRNPIDADTASGRVFQLRLQANSGPEFIVFDAGGTPYFATSGALSPLTKPALLLGRVSGLNISVWYDGVQRASGTMSTTANPLSGAAYLCIAASHNNSQGFPGVVHIGGYVDRALNDAEIVSLSANPWQLFAPLPRRMWLGPPAAAGGSHAATGALVAGSATIAGTALHPHASTGALSASAATIAGTAAHLTLHTSSGALIAGAATIAGTALHPHAATGAMVAGSATIAGTAARSTAGTHAANGALTADAATIAGSAAHLTLHAATGALVAGAAQLLGAGLHVTVHTSSGALVAGSASIAGAAARPSTHDATGALAADAAQISGDAFPGLARVESIGSYGHNGYGQIGKGPKPRATWAARRAIAFATAPRARAGGAPQPLPEPLQISAPQAFARAYVRAYMLKPQILRFPPAQPAPIPLIRSKGRR